MMFYTEIRVQKLNKHFFFHTRLPITRALLASQIRFYFAIQQHETTAPMNTHTEREKKYICINAIQQYLAMVQSNRFKSQQYVLEHQTKQKQENK